MSDTVKLHPDLRKKVDLLFKYLGSQGDNVYEYRFGAIGGYMEEYGVKFVSDSIDIPTNSWLDKIMEELFKTYYSEYIRDYAGNDYDEYYFVKFKIRPNTKQILVGVDWAEQTSEEYSSSVAFKDDSSIPEFMNGINCDKLKINFNGSGDDGYIDGYGVNEDGNQHQLTDSIEEEIYRALSREFGGWENNQGASGNMLIDMNDESIKINIEYYDQEYEDSGFELNIIE
jgi:hypothetical protein